jgi:cobalt-zinc-cadmium efflux system protein
LCNVAAADYHRNTAVLPRRFAGIALHVHSHSHAHDHAHGAPGERRLLIAFALTAATLCGEALGGWFSGSLALLADAGHMLVDAFALLVAWAGAHFARRPADTRRSFGYARIEVLVGYTNALAQFALSAWIVAEAVARLRAPEAVGAGLMFAVAAGGAILNAFVLRTLGGHAHDDVNAAGAHLHVLGDLLGSLGAMVAAVLIFAFGWLWADAALSIVVALLILGSAWELLRRSAHILLEGVPEGIEPDEVARTVREAAGVEDVHHVHVWQLAGGRRIATLHARVRDGADADAALRTMRHVLKEQFAIDHATVQIERSACVGEDCGGAAQEEWAEPHEHDHDHDHDQSCTHTH